MQKTRMGLLRDTSSLCRDRKGGFLRVLLFFWNVRFDSWSYSALSRALTSSSVLPQFVTRRITDC